VQFGQPHRVEPEALGRIDLLETAREGVALAAARHHRELVKHAEFHFFLLTGAPPAGYFFASA
jgi:hypothetical protein